MLVPCRHNFLVRAVNRGFTLMEMLVLVAILGILVLFVGPGLVSALDEAEIIQCQSHLEMIRRAKSSYVVDHLGLTSDGKLPANRHLFDDITILTDDENRGVFRAYLPERFKMGCPRGGEGYTDAYNLFKKSTCPYCEIHR